MYLAFDTETTGIDAVKNNLLTACFIVLNDNLIEIDRLNLSIKYNEYNISVRAMEINKIDLIKHHNSRNSVDLKTARSMLLDFLRKNKKAHSNSSLSYGYNLFTPIGHNVSFDINFIKGCGLLSEYEYNSYISFNCVDTICIAQFFKLTGEIPKKQSISLSNLCSYYNIKSEENTESYHTAEYDIVMTLHLLRKFKTLNENIMNEYNIQDNNNSKKRKRGMY
jgi:DNA polymerase III alpha subunit (gram-positive type)